MIYTGDPIDPGTGAPDLNLIEPGMLPPGTPTPVMPASNPIPSTMYAGMALSAIGSITTAISSASSLRAQGAYEASIAATNAKIAEVQKEQALETGDIQSAREISKSQQEVGQEKAIQGGSGVDVNSASSVLVRNATARVGQVNALTIKNNAQRQAWGYQTQALESTFQGEFAQLTAKAASTQSLLAGGLQAISGPLAIESNYLRFARYMGVGGSPEANTGNIPPPYPNMS